MIPITNHVLYCEVKVRYSFYPLGFRNSFLISYLLFWKKTKSTNETEYLTPISLVLNSLFAKEKGIRNLNKLHKFSCWVRSLIFIVNSCWVFTISSVSLIAKETSDKLCKISSVPEADC
jgi:hypothetical protein